MFLIKTKIKDNHFINKINDVKLMQFNVKYIKSSANCHTFQFGWNLMKHTKLHKNTCQTFLVLCEA